MLRKFKVSVFFFLYLISCKDVAKPQTMGEINTNDLELNLKQANRLAALPFGCIQVQYPNKLSQTLNDSTQIKSPKELHPAFYGCFDWHSSVHGHWSLLFLLKKYPNIAEAQSIRQKLAESITKEHIAAEVAYFKAKGNRSFERTYGWAWLLKMAEELYTWNDPFANELRDNLQPLTDLIVDAYIDFLPRLNYPIRVGVHSNTAFGLSFAWDYANTTNNEALKKVIEESVQRFYINDTACPLDWEPSGTDFLSPCLEEANLARKVLAPKEFKTWFKAFLPQLTNPSFKLEFGKVLDRTDGHLLHIDGLNFSRAWCLYGIAESLPEYGHLKNIADQHINYSLPNIVDDNYGGTHWLGTFALYALNSKK